LRIRDSAAPGTAAVRTWGLFNTLMMLALLAGGLGLIARSVRSH
jgi:hypothetical protein